MQFKTDVVNDFAAALVAHRAEFEARRKGSEWKAIVLALGYTFPEDREALFALVGGNAEAEKTGGGKVVRPKVNTGKRQKSGCADCPDTAGVTVAAGTAPPPRRVGGGANIPAGVPAASPFESVADVLERFESDENLMTIYAGKHGIDIGRARKAESIAEKIYEHYNPAE